MAEIRIIDPSTSTSARDAQDVALLLDELNRLLGSLANLSPRHPTRAALLQRAWSLWQLEAERGGPIDIERSGQVFSSEPLGSLQCRYLGDLVRAMEIHEVDRIRATADVTCDGFSRFVIHLALPTADLDQMCEGKFAGRLYLSSGPGIEINGIFRQTSDTPSTVEVNAVPPTPEDPSVGFASKSAWPELEDDPFEAPAMAMDGEKLRLALRELDRCEDDGLYDTLLDNILGRAADLWRAGHREEAYRALLVLADHASSDDCDADRPRRWMAQSALKNFAGLEHVDFLIDRATRCEAGGVRATQILLQVAEDAAPALLEALDNECDPDRSQQLAGMLLALGEAAVPVLTQTIARRSGSRLQLAVRLAGQLQNPKLVPTLASVLADSGPALRREAGMALVNVGNTEACDVLIKALTGESAELTRTAALCLGVLGEGQATDPLMATLARAIRAKSYRVATIVIRALGQLGSETPEVIAALGNVLTPSTWKAGKRRDPKDIQAAKCAALEVLATCSGRDAEVLLMAATQDPDAPVSRKAHELLNQQDRQKTA